MLLQKSSSVPSIAGSKPQGALRPNQLIPTNTRNQLWLKVVIHPVKSRILRIRKLNLARRKAKKTVTVIKSLPRRTSNRRKKAS